MKINSQTFEDLFTVRMEKGGGMAVFGSRSSGMLIHRHNFSTASTSSTSGTRPRSVEVDALGAANSRAFECNFGAFVEAEA